VRRKRLRRAPSINALGELDKWQTRPRASRRRRPRSPLRARLRRRARPQRRGQPGRQCPLHVPLSPGCRCRSGPRRQPARDNPGSLTAAELRSNRHRAAPQSQSQRGKAVSNSNRRHPSPHDDERRHAVLTIFAHAQPQESPHHHIHRSRPHRLWRTPTSRTAAHRLATHRSPPVSISNGCATTGRTSTISTRRRFAQPDTVRTLDQLEHVTSWAVRAERARLSPSTTITPPAL